MTGLCMREPVENRGKPLYIAAQPVDNFVENVYSNRLVKKEGREIAKKEGKFMKKMLDKPVDFCYYNMRVLHKWIWRYSSVG